MSSPGGMGTFGSIVNVFDSTMVNKLVCKLLFVHINSLVLPSCRGTKGQSSLKELLQPLVSEVLNDKNLAINTNPIELYKAWINQLESESGEAR